MRDLTVPTIQNLTTNFSIQGNHRYARYSIDITSSAVPSEVSNGDILQIGSARAIVLHTEHVPAKYRQLLGITALLLGQDAHLPSGDTLRVWAHPAGLPADPQAALLTAASAPGKPIYSQNEALTHLLQAAELLPATDSLTASIKDYIEQHRQQVKIVTQPGSGVAIGMVLSVTGTPTGQLKVISIDRQSIKGLEIATATPITAAEPPAPKKSLIDRLTGDSRHA